MAVIRTQRQETELKHLVLVGKYSRLKEIGYANLGYHIFYYRDHCRPFRFWWDRGRGLRYRANPVLCIHRAVSDFVVGKGRTRATASAISLAPEYDAGAVNTATFKLIFKGTHHETTL